MLKTPIETPTKGKLAAERARQCTAALTHDHLQKHKERKTQDG